MSEAYEPKNLDDEFKFNRKGDNLAGELEIALLTKSITELEKINDLTEQRIVAEMLYDSALYLESELLEESSNVLKIYEMANPNFAKNLVPQIELYNDSIASVGEISAYLDSRYLSNNSISIDVQSSDLDLWDKLID